jgi:hypothetical protein
MNFVFNIFLKDEEVNVYYKKNLENKLIKLDTYVFDMHTGHVSNEQFQKFAKESAFVLNENKIFYNKNYRMMYIGFKKILDEFNNKVKKFSNDHKRVYED